MTPKQVAAVALMLGWLFIAVCALTSCASVPVPPFGDRLGEAGTLHLRTSVRFEPRLPEARREAQSLLHALDQFQISTRTLRDK